MSGNIEDPSTNFYSAIDIQSSRVSLRPPTILLFGGPIDIQTKGLLSVRESIVERSCTHNSNIHDHLIIPEDFKDWAVGAKYSDLLTFETHIAQMATTIIVIPESPGSIAELGAFVVNEYVREKLLVILPDEYYHSDSFIKLGLLSQLEDQQIFGYGYDPREVASTIEPYVDNMITDFIEQTNKSDSTIAFDAENFGHISFCVFQIIQDSLALRKKEIVEAIKMMGLECSSSEANRMLYLLQKLNFIKEVREGNSSFYMAHDNRKEESRISYATQSGKRRVDPLGFKIDIAQYYESNSAEGQRRRALSRQIEGLTQ